MFWPKREHTSLVANNWVRTDACSRAHRRHRQSVLHPLMASLQHDMLISGIDWSPVSNKIVTCGHDRNAFVWTFSSETDKWEPSLVILRIDHAALHCKWSPDGLKFAVASSSKCVQVISSSGGISEILRFPGSCALSNQNVHAVPSPSGPVFRLVRSLELLVSLQTAVIVAMWNVLLRFATTRRRTIGG